jgi:hypothetical protein
MASEQEQARLQAGQPAADPQAMAAHKASLVGSGGGAIWRVLSFPTVADAVNFANLPPAQQAGQFGVVDDPAGGVQGYYFF